MVGKSQAECQKGYDTLCDLLLLLGFQLSHNKLVPPCQELSFLGILFNTVSLTLSLPPKKLLELQDIVCTFSQRKRASKRQLQQLAGCLN